MMDVMDILIYSSVLIDLTVHSYGINGRMNTSPPNNTPTNAPGKALHETSPYRKKVRVVDTFLVADHLWLCSSHHAIHDAHDRCHLNQRRSAFWRIVYNVISAFDV